MARVLTRRILLFIAVVAIVVVPLLVVQLTGMGNSVIAPGLDYTP